MTDEEIIELAHKLGDVRCDSRNRLDFEFDSHGIIKFARLIAARQREKDAVCAWNHYMDTCRKHGHGPSVDRIQDFCAADAIREQGD